MEKTLKIGQRVYFIEDNRICSDIIRRIKIEISAKKTRVYYYLNPGDDFGSNYKIRSVLYLSDKVLARELIKNKWDKKA